jgi:hypothetical protein
MTGHAVHAPEAEFGWLHVRITQAVVIHGQALGGKIFAIGQGVIQSLAEKHDHGQNLFIKLLCSGFAFLAAVEKVILNFMLHVEHIRCGDAAFATGTESGDELQTATAAEKIEAIRTHLLNESGHSPCRAFCL